MLLDITTICLNVWLYCFIIEIMINIVTDCDSSYLLLCAIVLWHHFITVRYGEFKHTFYYVFMLHVMAHVS